MKKVMKSYKKSGTIHRLTLKGTSDLTKHRVEEGNKIISNRR